MTKLERGILAAMIACVILFVTSLWVMFTKLGEVGAEVDDHGGLRAVFERIWCGKDGCK